MSYFVNDYRMDNPHRGHISHIGYMIFDTQLDRPLTRWPSMLVFTHEKSYYAVPLTCTEFENVNFKMSTFRMDQPRD